MVEIARKMPGAMAACHVLLTLAAYAIADYWTAAAVWAIGAILLGEALWRECTGYEPPPKEDGSKTWQSKVE